MASNINNNEPNKPIDYSLRVSRRARHAKLQIKPYGGLEVVIPVRFPKKAVPQLVNDHAEWIGLKLAQQQKRIGAVQLPSEIYFAINNSRIEVVSEAGKQPKGNNQHYLVLTKADYQQNVKQLRAWIRNPLWCRVRAIRPFLERSC